MTNPESTIKTSLSASNQLVFGFRLAYEEDFFLETGGVERDQATNIVTDFSAGGLFFIILIPHYFDYGSDSTTTNYLPGLNEGNG